MGLNIKEQSEVEVEEPVTISLNDKQKNPPLSLPSLQYLENKLRQCEILYKGEKVEAAFARLDGNAAEALKTVVHAIRRSQRGAGKHPSRTGLVGDAKILNPRVYLAQQIPLLEAFLATEPQRIAQKNILDARRNIEDIRAGVGTRIANVMKGI